MVLPRIVYETYPVFYITGGIASMALVNSTTAYASGLLLSLSGITILFIRRNYRAIKQELVQFS